MEIYLIFIEELTLSCPSSFYLFYLFKTVSNKTSLNKELSKKGLQLLPIIIIEYLFELSHFILNIMESFYFRGIYIKVGDDAP